METTDGRVPRMPHDLLITEKPASSRADPGRILLPVAWLLALACVLLPACRSGAIPAGDGAASVPAAVHDACRGFLEEHPLPGLSVAILEGDRILFARGYGWADIERRRPVTPETLFPIGSVEKQFTAAEILRLAEEGKLPLEDPITKYLSRLDTGGERVSIADMLNQVSGLQEARTRRPVHPDESAAAATGEPWAPVADKAVGEGFSSAGDIGSFAGQPLYFHPWDRFSYSQPNYDLLCYVIAELSGRSYYEAIGDLARSAVLTRYPEDDLTIAIMTNLGGASGIAYDLEPRIARLILGLDEPEVLDLPLEAAEQARYTGPYDAGAFRFDVVAEGQRIALVMRLAGPGEGGEVFRPQAAPQSGPRPLSRRRGSGVERGEIRSGSKTGEGDRDWDLRPGRSHECGVIPRRMLAAPESPHGIRRTGQSRSGPARSPRGPFRGRPRSRLLRKQAPPLGPRTR